MKGVPVSTLGMPPTSFEPMFTGPEQAPQFQQAVLDPRLVPAGGFGDTDTIVQRKSGLTLPHVGDSGTVPLQIIKLSLTSLEPITVTYGGANPTLYDVSVMVDPSIQTPGSMTIIRTSDTGGTFTFTLPVTSQFSFTNHNFTASQVVAPVRTDTFKASGTFQVVVETDVFPNSVAQIALQTPFATSPQTVTLSGPTTVQVNTTPRGDAADTDGNGLEEVATEMTQLNLTGASPLGPVTVRLDPMRPTLGQIEETTNTTPGRLDVPPFTPTGTASSVFDVFVEIDVGGQTFHTATPAHLQATITHEPPAPGETYVNTVSLALLDANNQPTPFSLLSEQLTPTPLLTVPVVSVTDAGGTYNGSPFHAAAAVAASIDGSFQPSLEGVSPILTYYAGSSVSGPGSAIAPSAAGTYTVVASFAGSTDYTAAQSTPLTFTIAPAPLTVTADSVTKTYGDPLPAFTVSSSGFVNGEGPSVLGGTLAFTTTATAASHAGSYGVTPGGLTAGNYTISYQSGTLTVTPAPLTITADNQSMTAGAPVPALTANYAGFVNGDTPADLATLTVLATSATSTSAPGTYAITVSGSSSPDYAITFVNGTLTVNPAQPIDPVTAYVTALYRDLLNRAPDPLGSTFWTTELRAGVPRLLVTQILWNSPEHRGLEVDEFYATYLHRAAEPAGRAGWVNALLSGLSETDVARLFLSSPEYTFRHPDAASFVWGLYADVLGRVPDAAEVASWARFAALPGLRPLVAQEFLTSPENYTGLVDSYYAEYLGRMPANWETSGWVPWLTSGLLSPAQVKELFFASNEYFGLASEVLAALLAYTGKLQGQPCNGGETMVVTEREYLKPKVIEVRKVTLGYGPNDEGYVDLTKEALNLLGASEGVDLAENLAKAFSITGNAKWIWVHLVQDYIDHKVTYKCVNGQWVQDKDEVTGRGTVDLGWKKLWFPNGNDQTDQWLPGSTVREFENAVANAIQQNAMH